MSIVGTTTSILNSTESNINTELTTVKNDADVTAGELLQTVHDVGKNTDLALQAGNVHKNWRDVESRMAAQ